MNSVEYRHPRLVHALVMGATTLSLLVSAVMIGFEISPSFKTWFISVVGASIFHNLLGAVILGTIVLVIFSYVTYLYRREVDDTLMAKSLSAFSWLVLAVLFATVGLLIIDFWPFE